MGGQSGDDGGRQHAGGRQDAGGGQMPDGGASGTQAAPGVGTRDPAMQHTGVTASPNVTPEEAVSVGVPPGVAYHSGDGVEVAGGRQPGRVVAVRLGRVAVLTVLAAAALLLARLRHGGASGGAVGGGRSARRAGRRAAASRQPATRRAAASRQPATHRAAAALGRRERRAT